MDRRAFFRQAADKVAHKAIKHAETKANTQAAHWIRPPYALEELEFLLACTRCGECVKACPHDTIFALPARLGAQVLNTPALDLVNKSCHLCEDWPCVNACEPGALVFPKDEEEPLQPPIIAHATLNITTCLPYSGPECGACRVCTVEGAMQWNMEKPVIVAEKCIGCGQCREACIVEPKAIIVQSSYKT